MSIDGKTLEDFISAKQRILDTTTTSMPNASQMNGLVEEVFKIIILIMIIMVLIIIIMDPTSDEQHLLRIYQKQRL